MSTKKWENNYRNSFVCIDSYEKGVPVGRLYNSARPSCVGFQSLMEFIKQMDALLDDMTFPQHFVTVRSFQSPQAESIEPCLTGCEKQVGKLATFKIRVLFRQNASWQGSIAWLEGSREESFRSVLELLLLMDSALGERSASGE